MDATLNALRYVNVNGREFAVASMRILQPQVLDGSKGKLYYPPDEIEKDYERWNGMPMVVYHPNKDGMNISARSPEVMQKQEIGRIYNTKLTSDHALDAEGWFDVELTKKIDARVWDDLTNGNKIEISTGLFTENKPAPQNSKYNGKEYTHIARNYRPDHLAILPDQVGACSVKDGCGVFNEGVTFNSIAGSIQVNADCGTGAGGFKPGNDCASGDGDSSNDPDKQVETAEKKFPSAELEERPRNYYHDDPKNPTYEGEVSGLSVRTKVPNEDSISATYESHEYTELDGIRKVNVSELSNIDEYGSADDNKKVDKLVGQIKESKSISPLIVTVDSKGKQYVLEGGHRARALKKMGIKEIPAVIVVVHNTTNNQNHTSDIVLENLVKEFVEHVKKEPTANPSWVKDHDKWSKAKEAASKEGGSDNYALITDIYKRMGGAINIESSNSDTYNSGDNMPKTREESVSWLINNCDCYKNVSGAKDVLAKMSVDQYATVFANNAKEAIENEDSKFFEWMNNASDDIKGAFVKMIKNKIMRQTGNEFPVDPEKMKKKPDPNNPNPQPQPDAAPEPDMDDEMKKKKAMMQQQAATGNTQMTEQQFMQTIPPSLQEVINNAKRITEKEKTRLVGVLTNHLTDNSQKSKAQQILMSKSLEDLQERVALMPHVPQSQQSNQQVSNQSNAPYGVNDFYSSNPSADYFGQVGVTGNVGNNGYDVSKDILDTPVINWAQEAELLKNGK